MEMYILLNESGYVRATSNSKLKDSIKLKLPEDFDYNKQSCYKLLNGQLVYDKEKENEHIKSILRSEREEILRAFDIYKTNVLYGIEQETEEEKVEIINWYNQLLDLNDNAFDNISAKITRYL